MKALLCPGCGAVQWRLNCTHDECYWVVCSKCERGIYAYVTKTLILSSLRSR